MTHNVVLSYLPERLQKLVSKIFMLLAGKYTYFYIHNLGFNAGFSFKYLMAEMAIIKLITVDLTRLKKKT